MTYSIDDIETPPEDPFKNDRLDRKPAVEFLSNLISRLDGPFVMALDSSFGTGKTTLVRILIECLRNEGHTCIYFDAWKIDYATDPLLGLVASIDRIELGSLNENQKATFQNHIRKVKIITAAIGKTSSVNLVKLLTSGVIDFNEILLALKSSEFNEESKLLKKISQ